jgi:hypothetical protein
MLYGDQLHRIKLSDRLGTPRLSTLSSTVGPVSSNTLRYAWIHSQLRQHFRMNQQQWGSGRNFSVCEIGGG